MNRLYIHSVGIIAPGMDTWLEAATILRGEKRYEKTEVPKFTPNLLRPNERRRTTSLIKLALQVGEQAIENADISADQVSSVFASSEGDIDIVDKICHALTLPDRPVSPTHFHNSVHNAPAGYWAIATGSHLPSISMSAGAGTLVGGLLEAAGLCATENTPTILVCYDYPPPEILKSKISIDESFGCAFVMSGTARENSMAQIQLELINSDEQTCLTADPALESLRLCNPTARILPLLQAIACKQQQTVVLPYLDEQKLQVSCSPC